jgi:hypothetical protein
MIEGNGKTERIEVTVNSKQMQELIEQNNILTKKLEKAEQGEQLFANIRSKLTESYQNAGLPEPHVESIEDLNNAVETLKRVNESKTPKQVVAGVVPLETQQSSSDPQFFTSPESLIDNLRDRASAMNPNKQDKELAKAQLDTLMLKAFKGQKDCNKPFDFTMPKEVSINDVLSAKYQRRRKLAKGE